MLPDGRGRPWSRADSFNQRRSFNKRWSITCVFSSWLPETPAEQASLKGKWAGAPSPESLAEV